MKVLYISHEAELYGAPRSLLEYVIKIKEKGIEPIVIMPCKGGLQTELNRNEIKNIIIPYYNCVHNKDYKLVDYVRYTCTNFKAITCIRKLIKEEHIDLVHTNTMAVNVGAVAAYISRIPHIWHFREYMEEDFGYKRLHTGITRKLVRKSSCCIAVSEGIRKKYQREYSINSIRLYDGIECSSYEHPVNMEKDIKERPELLLAGAICEGKGQWDAIQAVKILVDKGIDVHLSIVGSGNPAFVKALKKYIKNKELTKYITVRSFTRRLQELRIRSTIILVCSRMEAFGRVTAEAMMAGKIVIGTNTGGTLELLGQNETRGYLYRYSHPEELAGKIEHVLLNWQEVVEKERKAQAFIKELTDMEKYTDRLIQIYTKSL